MTAARFHAASAARRRRCRLLSPARARLYLSIRSQSRGLADNPTLITHRIRFARPRVISSSRTIGAMNTRYVIITRDDCRIASVDYLSEDRRDRVYANAYAKRYRSIRLFSESPTSSFFLSRQSYPVPDEDVRENRWSNEGDGQSATWARIRNAYSR